MTLSERLAKRRGQPNDATVEEAPPLPLADQGDGALTAPPAHTKPRAAPRRVVQLTPTLVSAQAAIHDVLVEEHASDIDVDDDVAIRALIESITGDYIRRTRLVIGSADRRTLVESLIDRILGLGPLQPLLEDPSITEVMINRFDQVYIEQDGRTQLTDIKFESEAALRQVINRVVSTIGRRVDESQPICDSRLKDGSRVNVVLPPLVPTGACMCIRKFGIVKLTADDLIRRRSASAQIMEYLAAAVRIRLSIIVSGGTSSGKTTLLNVLSADIPRGERIITIEDSAELQLQQGHVITMEGRPPNVEGQGAVHIRELVRNSLRMRPDRVIVGETRGPEAIDMLQAMNTGHDGSMSTVHANSPVDAISRLETMVLMAGTELPLSAIRRQIASAIDVVVQVSRVRGGERKIVGVSEVIGLENGEVALREIFRYQQVKIGEDGRALGYHTAVGVPSSYMERFAANGEPLSANLFEPTPQPADEDLH